MERTIRVTGKGRITVAPDIIRVIITQSGIRDTHESAIKASAESKQELNKGLVGIGFNKEDLKTTHFNINTEYRQYNDRETGEWKKEFIGYKFTHNMKLEFSIASNMLGKVLAVVASCSDDPEFSIHYTVSDPDKAKNELLEKAVTDSKVKASVLSNAAGVRLKEIVFIDYSWGEVNFVSNPVDTFEMGGLLRCAKMTDSIDLDIEPEDIDVTDTVTVVWSIF